MGSFRDRLITELPRALDGRRLATASRHPSRVPVDRVQGPRRRTPGTAFVPGTERYFDEVAKAELVGTELCVAAAIEGEQAPLLGRDDATAQAAAIKSLYASADQGSPVEVVDGRPPGVRLARSVATDTERLVQLGP